MSEASKRRCFFFQAEDGIRAAHECLEFRRVLFLSSVLMYNKEQIAEKDLPSSILDLADPEWKGKVSFSPTGADFQAIVSAVLELKGEAATKKWLKGLAANGEVYDGNNIEIGRASCRERVFQYV